MPTVNMTQELRDIIKDERKKRDISTLTLSKAIKRGKAYISQIESGKISAIDIKIFYAIFEEIIDMPDAERNEYIMNNILDKVTINLSKEEIEKQEWIITFDMKVRQFPLNDNIRKIINEKRTSDKINKTPEEFILYINENTDLENKDDYKPNQLSVKVTDDGTIVESIKFEFPNDFIEKIENGSMKTISYIDMQGILYNLLRLEGINPIDSIEETKIILKNNGFLTLSERKMIIRDNFQQKISKNEDFNYYDLEPTDLEKEHAKTMEEIIAGFKYIRNKNIVFSNKQITQLCKNMKSDIGFMYAIFGLPFDKLEILDFETKKKLLLDMKKLLKLYIPESELMLEGSTEED